VKNEEVLHRVKEDRNILETIKRRKANSTGNTLRRSCHLQHGIQAKLQGMIKKTRRRGRRRKQPL
jgi:hypothetical protein